ncbi:hypothetical protein C8F01DRAFT_1144988 [Mycena amicta]|nr:hypothetical protein C8F01DRAFT_1144988 [Mycena amicta]
MALATIPGISIPPYGSLGATEIGSVIAVFLFGIETLQVYTYYRRSSGDSRLLKWTVAIVWFLELAHVISAWHALYSQTVVFYGNPLHVLRPPRSELLTTLFSSILYLIVQTFFANRVRILSGRWYIMAIASTLSTLRFVANMSTFALLWKYERVTIILEEPGHWLVTSALSLGLAVDILITASMCYYLQMLRGADSKRLQHMVESLILWSIESTVLTSTTSILQIILFLTRTDLVWTIFFIIQAKLISNAMLASLNGRRRLHARDHQPTTDVLHFKTSAGPGYVRDDRITISLVLDSERSFRASTRV